MTTVKDQPIYIVDSPTGGILHRDITAELLHESTIQHRYDVQTVALFFAQKLCARSLRHDHTKIDGFDDFHKFITRQPAYDNRWWETHITTERHHLDDAYPASVDLLDVLEWVADGVCAGMARMGTYRPINLNKDDTIEMLKLAIRNTEKMLLDAIQIIDKETRAKMIREEITPPPGYPEPKGDGC